jgi:hypothetical protein
MTFNQVIAAIRRIKAGAELGRTAQHGQYFQKAIKMTNFVSHNGDPLRYRADKPGGGYPMWLYFGARGTICCGDKPWL